MARSTDGGVNWTSTVVGGSARNGVAYGDGRWVVVSYNSGVFDSTDGISWTQILLFGALGSRAIRSVAYGNGRWVVVGDQGGMAHSANVLNWAAIPAGGEGKTFANNQHITGVAYGNGMWIAVGTDGRMAYSIEAGD